MGHQPRISATLLLLLRCFPTLQRARSEASSVVGRSRNILEQLARSIVGNPKVGNKPPTNAKAHPPFTAPQIMPSIPPSFQRGLSARVSPAEKRQWGLCPPLLSSVSSSMPIGQERAEIVSAQSNKQSNAQAQRLLVPRLGNMNVREANIGSRIGSSS